MRKTDQVIIDVIKDPAPGQAESATPPIVLPPVQTGQPVQDVMVRELPPPTPKTIFTVGTQRFETNGINRQQMMELFKLYPRVAKKWGQEKAADVLKNEFHLEHRADLTEEQAERYEIRLREMLGEL